MKLTLEVEAGENFDNCAKKALQIAVLLDVDVEWIFNTFHCYARPDSQLGEIHKRYQANFNNS